MDECLYCGFETAGGAVLEDSGLCTGCAATPPLCDKPLVHGWPCDCAAGLCS